MKNDEFIVISSTSEPLSAQSRLSKKSTKKNKKKKQMIKKQHSEGGSSSSQFDESKCLPENRSVLNFYDMKECQICKHSEDSKNMFLCDKCEDGYHFYCLEYKVDRKAQIIICPRCQQEQRQIQKGNQSIRQEIDLKTQKNCELCKKPFQDDYFDRLLVGQNFDSVEMGFQEQFEKRKCLYCGKQFHFQCFNMRTNALNCSACQKQIRSKCPKGHKKFLKYYQGKYHKFSENQYFTLTPLPAYLRPKIQERYPKINLKLPAPVTNWQFITQYQASIYYAFETKRLNFIEDQIYDDKKVMQLNKWNGEFMPVFQLHQEDQKVFKMFKQNTTNGVIVGPYQIKEDRFKGFHIVATDFIQKMTIITQYVGQVVTARRSLFHHKHNDSIFSLIKNTHSYLSLDIVPQAFGNISRFFSGINNKKSESRKALNVQAKKFSYKGRVRIIFYALKDIQAGDELYYDYNGGLFHEYPTQNFKV